MYILDRTAQSCLNEAELLWSVTSKGYESPLGCACGGVTSL